MVSTALPYQDICILRLSAIGDVCHAVAAVQAIQRQYPDAKITWVIGKIEASLLQDLPGIEWIIFDKKQGRKAYRQLRQQLKGRLFDVLLHMQVAFRANLVAACIKAKQKVGFDKARAKEGHSLFINQRINDIEQPHVLDGFLAFAQAIGVPLAPPQWQMPRQAQDQQFAQQTLAAFEPTKTRTLVISPAASKAERNWLPERYATIALLAQQLGFKVVLTGSPSPMERTLATTIEQQMATQDSQAAKPLNLVGKTNLKQLLCVLAEADIVIAPDSGPAHMAVTVGTPVIGLYSHSNPRRTGPYCYQDYVVEVYQYNLQQQYGRPAEQLPWGKRCKGADLMAQISVAAVAAMLHKVIKETLTDRAEDHQPQQDLPHDSQ